MLLLMCSLQTYRKMQLHGTGTLETALLQPSRIQTILISQQEVNLIVSNVNETASKNAMITVLTDSSSSGGSSSGGSSGVGSPEPATNIEVKEISQAFIKNGNSVKFDFPRNATSVVYASFDSKKTAGQTTTIVEMLKEKSTLVSGLPSDEVYKSLNIWVCLL